MNLADHDNALSVLRGHVDLFAQATVGGVLVGGRRHLFRVEAGGLVLGLASCSPVELGRDAQKTGVSIVAVGGQDSEVAGENRKSVDETRLHEWIARLSAVCAEIAGDRDVPIVGRGALVQLQAAERRRTLPDGLTWLRVIRGEIRLNDLSVGSASGEPPLPLSAGTCFQAVENAAVQTLASLDLPSGEVWSAVDRFHRLVIARIGETMAAALTVDRADIERRSRQSAEQTQRLLGRLAMLMVAPAKARETASNRPGDPLWSACATVADAIGATLKVPVGRNAADSSLAAVIEIARQSRLRTRRVQLRGEWWQRDVGALIAWRGPTRRPVAVIPVSAGRYSLFDPELGEHARVDAALAAELAVETVMLYRTLPATAPSAPGVLAFGLRKGRADLLRILTAGVMLGFVSLLAPIATRMIVDSVIPETAFDQLAFCTLGLILAAIAIAGCQLSQGIATLRLENRLDAALQAALVDRILRLPTRFFHRYTQGELADRVMAIPAMRLALAGRLIRVLASLFALFNVVLMFVYDTGLAWVALVFMLMRLVILFGVLRLRLGSERRLAEVQGKVSGYLLQLILGIGKLQVAAAIGRALELWSRLFAEQKGLAFNSQRLANAQVATDVTLTLVASLFVFGCADLPASGGAGQFIAFLAAFGIASAGMTNLAAVLGESLVAIPYWRRLQPLLVEPLESNIECDQPGPLTGKIELDQVTFRYLDSAAVILEKVSFAVGAGECVAIVGPSGAGKSTLFRLLLGFEKPQSGRIFIDGKAIDRLDSAALRQQFGVVLQQNNMLWRSIYDTICGGSALPLEQAWEAARLAGLAEDIRGMPMGMHTVLTGGISVLSGGQRQRLMIARALVRRPRVLLFDEATSALDNRTQASVSASLASINATRLIIAHRLSTVRTADRVIVMEGGHIVQQGAFDELAQQPGMFAELMRRQLL